MSPQRQKKIEHLIKLFESNKVLVDEAPVEKVLFSPVNGDLEGKKQRIQRYHYRRRTGLCVCAVQQPGH